MNFKLFPKRTIEPRIPCELLIGVTGHRVLPGEELLVRIVNELLDEVSTRFVSPVVFRALSPLAEGADRLVAREVLLREGSSLAAVLPLTEKDYLGDFHTGASRSEFEMLLGQASEVITLPPKGTRTAAYSDAGRYVVDHADIVIALWDGGPPRGEGGTAEIVAYAREKDKPLYWINTQDCTARSERMEALNFTELEVYNAEKRGLKGYADTLQSENSQWDKQAAAIGIPEEYTKRITGHFLPHQCTADLLAMRYKKLYIRAGNMIYVLAASAVGIVALQSLFFEHHPKILTFEVLFMLLILLALWRFRRWHRKWIDYRFLTERIRSAVFEAIVGETVVGKVEYQIDAPRDLSLAHTPNDWVLRAFMAIERALPPAVPPPAIDLVSLKQFVINAWIAPQIKWHSRETGRSSKKYERIEATSVCLFALAFFAALGHVIFTGEGMKNVHPILGFVGILAPTIGGAMTAIRTFREYHRNAKRSWEMEKHLCSLRDALAASTAEQFLPLFRELVDLMIREHLDWRIMTIIRKPGLPA